MQQLLATRRGRLLVRRLMIVLAFAVAAAIFASPAAAGPPTKNEFTYDGPGYDLTEGCSFPVATHVTANVTAKDFVDKSGALTRTSWHVVEQDTFTANGKTLVGMAYTYNQEVLFDGSGVAAHIYVTGQFGRVLLPDGSLFHAAGRADFLAHSGFLLSPDKGNPGNVAGFCAALAP